MIKINLIPCSKKEEIRQSRRLIAALRWEIELAGIILVFAAMLFSINYILQINLSSAPADSDFAEGGDSRISQLAKNDDKIKSLNSSSLRALKIQGGQLRWMNLFNKLNEKVSEEISLSEISTKDYVVSLSGNAKTRDDIIEFKIKIEEDDCFSGMNFPLSNLVSKENIEFKMSFEIKESCIKL